jgi:hypothetical protein
LLFTERSKPGGEAASRLSSAERNEFKYQHAKRMAITC